MGEWEGVRGGCAGVWRMGGWEKDEREQEI